MKMKNEDKVLIGVGLLGLGTIGFFYWKKKKQQKEDELLLDIPKPITIVATPIVANKIPTTGATLDKTKVLFKGSKGIEVRELQRLLGITIDGDFGAKTLDALQRKKGVSQISLSGYVVAKTVVAPKATPTALVMPKVGQKLMANATNVSLFNAKRTASGTYFNDGTKPFLGSAYKYGEHIGTFVGAKTGGQYLIMRDDVYYFVNANAVKAY